MVARHDRGKPYCGTGCRSNTHPISPHLPGSTVCAATMHGLALIVTLPMRRCSTRQLSGGGGDFNICTKFRYLEVCIASCQIGRREEHSFMTRFSICLRFFPPPLSPSLSLHCVVAYLRSRVFLPSLQEIMQLFLLIVAGAASVATALVPPVPRPGSTSNAVLAKRQVDTAALPARGGIPRVFRRNQPSTIPSKVNSFANFFVSS